MPEKLKNLLPLQETRPQGCCAATEPSGRTPRDDPQEIRREVRLHYAGVADQQLDGCGQAECCGNDLYVGEDLGQLPETAIHSSRGCGNPHAIASLRPGEVVLDLGSGGGLDVLLAARQVGDDGFVFGVDMTEKMLELARANAAKMEVTNVEFRKGDLEELPLPSCSVDVIISNCVVNLTPDKGRALGEAYRVLKPGGRLAISDVVVDGDFDDLPVTEAQIRSGLSWAGCIAGAMAAADLTQLMEDCGFEEASIDVEYRYTVDDFPGRLPQTLRELPKPVLEGLIQRFTSSNIQARKPVG